MTKVTWDIQEYLDKRGWENANQLAVGVGITYPVASRVLANKPMRKVEVATLEKLRVAFVPRGLPWSLLKYEPDPPKARR